VPIYTAAIDQHSDRFHRRVAKLLA